MKKCKKCGKELKNEKYEICFDCYKKKKQSGGIDIEKPIPFKIGNKEIWLPIWLLGIIFLLGTIVGAYLW